MSDNNMTEHDSTTSSPAIDMRGWFSTFFDRALDTVAGQIGSLLMPEGLEELGRYQEGSEINPNIRYKRALNVGEAPQPGVVYCSFTKASDGTPESFTMTFLDSMGEMREHTFDDLKDWNKAVELYRIFDDPKYDDDGNLTAGSEKGQENLRVQLDDALGFACRELNLGGFPPQMQACQFMYEALNDDSVTVERALHTKLDPLLTKIDEARTKWWDGLKKGHKGDQDATLRKSLEEALPQKDKDAILNQWLIVPTGDKQNPTKIIFMKDVPAELERQIGVLNASMPKESELSLKGKSSEQDRLEVLEKKTAAVFLKARIGELEDIQRGIEHNLSLLETDPRYGSEKFIDWVLDNKNKILTAVAFAAAGVAAVGILASPIGWGLSATVVAAAAFVALAAVATLAYRWLSNEENQKMILESSAYKAVASFFTSFLETIQAIPGNLSDFAKSKAFDMGCMKPSYDTKDALDGEAKNKIVSVLQDAEMLLTQSDEILKTHGIEMPEPGSEAKAQLQALGSSMVATNTGSEVPLSKGKLDDANNGLDKAKEYKAALDVHIKAITDTRAGLKQQMIEQRDKMSTKTARRLRDTYTELGEVLKHLNKKVEPVINQAIKPLQSAEAKASRAETFQSYKTAFGRITSGLTDVNVFQTVRNLFTKDADNNVTLTKQDVTSMYEAAQKEVGEANRSSEYDLSEEHLQVYTDFSNSLKGVLDGMSDDGDDVPLNPEQSGKLSNAIANLSGRTPEAHQGLTGRIFAAGGSLLKMLSDAFTKANDDKHDNDEEETHSDSSTLSS